MSRHCCHKLNFPLSLSIYLSHVSSRVSESNLQRMANCSESLKVPPYQTALSIDASSARESSARSAAKMMKRVNEAVPSPPPHRVPSTNGLQMVFIYCMYMFSKITRVFKMSIHNVTRGKVEEKGAVFSLAVIPGQILADEAWRRCAVC